MIRAVATLIAAYMAFVFALAIALNIVLNTLGVAVLLFGVLAVTNAQLAGLAIMLSPILLRAIFVKLSRVATQGFRDGYMAAKAKMEADAK